MCWQDSSILWLASRTNRQILGVCPPSSTTSFNRLAPFSSLVWSRSDPISNTACLPAWLHIVPQIFLTLPISLPCHNCDSFTHMNLSCNIILKQKNKNMVQKMVESMVGLDMGEIQCVGTQLRAGGVWDRIGLASQRREEKDWDVEKERKCQVEALLAAQVFEMWKE